MEKFPKFDKCRAFISKIKTQGPKFIPDYRVDSTANVHESPQQEGRLA